MKTMSIGLFGAALVLAIAPVPAVAANDGLACALRTLSPQFGAAIAERYAADGPDGDYDELVDETEMERVARACVDLSAPDSDEQSTRLGESLMAFHLMKAAEAGLAAREGVSAAQLDAAWSLLDAGERAAVNVIANRGAGGEAMGPVLLKLGGSIRPGLDPAQPTAERLLADIAVYAITRALLEEREGR